MQKHYAWPSIEQFRNVCKNVTHRAQYVGKAEDGSAIMNRAAIKPTLKFEGTVKLHGCVHADTLITLADGSEERIKDILSGTSILSYNCDLKKVEYDTVKNVVVQELDKTWLELGFDNGTILKCTEDHPILTTEGWVEAKDLKITHILIDKDSE